MKCHSKEYDGRLDGDFLPIFSTCENEKEMLLWFIRHRTSIDEAKCWTILSCVRQNRIFGSVVGQWLASNEASRQMGIEGQRKCIGNLLSNLSLSPTLFMEIAQNKQTFPYNPHSYEDKIYMGDIAGAISDWRKRKVLGSMSNLLSPVSYRNWPVTTYQMKQLLFAVIQDNLSFLEEYNIREDDLYSIANKAEQLVNNIEGWISSGLLDREKTRRIRSIIHALNALPSHTVFSALVTLLFQYKLHAHYKWDFTDGQKEIQSLLTESMILNLYKLISEANGGAKLIDILKNSQLIAMVGNDAKMVLDTMFYYNDKTHYSQTKMGKKRRKAIIISIIRELSRRVQEGKARDEDFAAVAFAIRWLKSPPYKMKKFLVQAFDGNQEAIGKIEEYMRPAILY